MIQKISCSIFQILIKTETITSVSKKAIAYFGNYTLKSNDGNWASCPWERKG